MVYTNLRHSETVLQVSERAGSHNFICSTVPLETRWVQASKVVGTSAPEFKHLAAASCALYQQLVFKICRFE